ncbi:MAG: aldolase, partial [Bacteroidales bacterium]|nr:aldolase [Bacteroidales bacterium]
ILSGEEPPEPELQAYLNNFNAGSMCLVNIESVAAIENLDLLLSVPGLDAVIIGPHDLSVSLGLPEQYEHPEYQKTVTEIIRKSRAKGIHAGIHFPSDPNRQIRYMKEGANIVLHSTDVVLFSQKLREDMARIKDAAGELSVSAEGEDLVI